MVIKKWSKIKEGTLLIIVWDDIVSDSSWVKDIDAQRYKPVRCKDVGWFINSDKLNIRITSSVNNMKERNVSVFPKGVIRDVQIIKYDEKFK